MPYYVCYDAHAQCVVARVSGELGLPLVRALFTEEAVLAQRHHCTRFLLDLSHAAPRLSRSDIARIPAIASRAGLKLWFREAIVANGHKQQYDLLQSVSEHEGQGIRVFETVGQARSWLRGETALRRTRPGPANEQKSQSPDRAGPEMARA